MVVEVYLLAALIIGLVALLAFWLSHKISVLSQAGKPSEELLQVIKMLQDGSQADRKVLLDSLQKNTQSLNERLDNAARVISQVQRNIGEMSEIGRGMKDLQEFLRSPKLRGNIGEEVLQDLIGQMFPKNSFFLQHQFKSGNKVDAAIKTDAGILPIDSKFPMENFQRMVKGENDGQRGEAKKEFIRDVKTHVDAIAQKYILPEEGTMDFALMYVPAESVFYELIQIPEITNFAKSRRVYPVSPSTLYAHLQMILLSFEGKKLETKSKEVFKLLRAIKGDYEKVDGSLSILGGHIKNAYNQMSNVLSGFTLLGQKLTSTQSLGEPPESEITQLEEKQ